MPRDVHADPIEHYAFERNRYVLFVAGLKVLETAQVAVLLDQRLGALVTHGAPELVRRELDELKRLARIARMRHYEGDWLLLEGLPAVDDLNRVLQIPDDIAVHKEAFLAPEERTALRSACSLLARIGARR
jgi:hypothetical protein